MNEEPNSSRETTRKRPAYSIVWLILLAATLVILLAVTPFLAGGPRRFSDWIPACLILFVVSFVTATVLLGVWLLARWLCRWRNLKRLFLAGACLGALMALFYAEEDWRGWQAWNQFKKEWEPKGEHFALASLVPPPVPDEENFALTPIAYTSYGQVLTRDGKTIPVEKRDGQFAVRMRMPITLDYPGPTNCTGDWGRGTFIRLECWQSHYRDLAARTNGFPVPAQPQSPAADVLLALSRYDAVIEELRVASGLPHSRFPVNYDCESPWGISLPHLAVLKSCAQVLRLRSVAELQNDQADQAFQDVGLGLELTDKIRTEPLLISHLVRLAMVQLMLQPVWEGLANHKWSDTQLATLEAELAKLDFPAAWRLSMRGEVAGLSDSMQLLRRHPEKLRELEDLSDFNGNKLGSHLPGRLVASLIPAGWYYQNQHRCARMVEAYYIPLADPGLTTFSPETARRADAALAATTSGPFNLCARLLLPMLANSATKFARGQAAVDLARTAIALERCRLARGEFPESLAALVPQCIDKVPRDVIGGQGLKYRREAGDQFVLYSVGWNEMDDGGVTSLKKDGSVDIESGDWVWRYSARAE
jgi:hypothetical protein